MDHFKILTINQLNDVATVDDLLWWEAYMTLEGPLGSRRQDIQAASISQTIGAVHGNKGSLSEYMLRWKPKPQSSWDDLWATFSGIAARQAK